VCTGLESLALHVIDLRAVRRGLAELGLDWDQPAYRPAPATVPRRLDIEIVAPEAEPAP
jgi:hypothetical protein